MIPNSTYLAARMVAQAIENHFALQHADLESGVYGPEPTAPIIEALLDAAFWASMRREEGHSPKISLAYLAPEHADKPLLFQKRIPLRASTLTKLSPGVERPGIHLGVWSYDDELYIWGTTHKTPDLCMVLDVSEPGLLVIKHRRPGGFGKFVNVAILNGDQVKLVDVKKTHLSDGPSLLSNLLGTSFSPVLEDTSNTLVQLAVSMRAHGRGGALLVVPQHTTSWRESIVHPIKYTLEPSYLGISALMRENSEQRNTQQWQNALKREVEHLAGLTAIDGAVIMNDAYELLAFGSKIAKAEGKAHVNSIRITEPILGIEASVVHPAESGGTRHLSAAQFVHDQPDSIALVSSQDGRFTIFSWSPGKEIVQAHRIEVLLL